MTFFRRTFNAIGRGIRKWVPNVVGQTRTTANANLNTAGFRTGTQTSTTTYNTGLDQQIISTTPSAGNQHGAGEAVDYNYYQYTPPFFPPFFPPHFGPFFPPFFPPGFSIYLDTLVRTPEGLVPAGNLQVGDVLISADIAGFPYDWTEGMGDAFSWESADPQITLTETTIQDIKLRTADYAIVINGDIFSNSHYILIKRDGVARFVLVEDVVDTDQVYDYDLGQFSDIELIGRIDEQREVVSINTEPYDIFFTENMLVHDSNPIT